MRSVKGYLSVSKIKWLIGVILAVSSIVSCLAYTYHNWGVRTTIRKNDYEVLRKLFGESICNSMLIRRVHVEFYKPGLIASPDVIYRRA